MSYRIEVELNGDWVDADRFSRVPAYDTEEDALREIALRVAAGNLTRPTRVVENRLG